jgi:PEP-CTERM motif
VQIQYFGPGAQGSRSLQVVALLGVTGDYDGLPLYVYDQQFICGNCLAAFTLGDNLTDSQFMFRGFLAVTTITELFPGGPYTDFVFAAFADEVVVLPRSVPEPATLALLGIALAGVGFARRRKRH